MSQDESPSKLLDKLFAAAVLRHGGDAKGVVNEVKAQIAALEPEDRKRVDGAFERLLAFRAPDLPRRSLH